MAETARSVVTVVELLGAELIAEKGVAVRFVGAGDAEHVVQVPTEEAHALSDMLAIALSRG